MRVRTEHQPKQIDNQKSSKRSPEPEKLTGKSPENAATRWENSSTNHDCIERGKSSRIVENENEEEIWKRIDERTIEIWKFLLDMEEGEREGFGWGEVIGPKATHKTIRSFSLFLSYATLRSLALTTTVRRFQRSPLIYHPRNASIYIINNINNTCQIPLH